MELLFNELSISPLSADKYAAKDKMVIFAKAISEAKKNGFKNIRSYLASNQIILAVDGYSLYDWINSKERETEILRSFLYGMIIQPFIKDDDENIVAQFVEADYYFEDIESNIKKTKCLGLASAYLYETISASLSSDYVWEKIKLQIIIEKEGNTNIEQVFNISSEESFGDVALAQFVQNTRTLTLVSTNILPIDKSIHLADHHGIAELTVLCNLLRNNPYVVEMRSMEWCRGRCTNFIKNTSANGVIEIVLFKTQRKYGLWVQTTGRNLRETNAIAEILDEKYS